MSATDATHSVRVGCAAAMSTLPELAAAVGEAIDVATSKLQGSCDLAMVFVSSQYGAGWEQLGARLVDRLQTESVLACTGESIVGPEREIEQQPAVAIWLAHLPGARITPIRLQYARTSEGAAFTGWPIDLPPQWSADAAMLCLADPFTFAADELIGRINEDHPGARVLGGMASGAMRPGENRLMLGRQLYNDGAVAVLLEGAARIRAVVSQGCRPIGHPMVITKADGNVILELGAAPALARLQGAYSELTASEQQLVRQGLHVGLVINEYQDQFQRGDFLVRNVVGADPKTGAIAIADRVRVGQTVQFHIRDAHTADEDLRSLLAATDRSTPPAGALLFTCNGRGTRLFSEPHHDVECIRDVLGEIPVAGFFAQGELGPIGGKNFLHGFTASIALFGG